MKRVTGIGGIFFQSAGREPSEPAAIRSDAGADCTAPGSDGIGDGGQVRIEIKITASWVRVRRSVGKKSGRTRSHCVALVRMAIPGEACRMKDFSILLCRRNRRTMAAVFAVRKEIPG